MQARHLLSLAVTLCAITACGPKPDPTEQRPEPQASANAEQHTELRDAIQAPQDKARAVEDQTLQAAEAQRKAIEAQTH